MYCLFCVVLCIVCVYMYTVLLPPGGYPVAVNKYIVACLVYFHWMVGFCKAMKTSLLPLGVQRTNLSIPLFFWYFKNAPTVVFHRFLPSFLRIFHRSFFSIQLHPLCMLRFSIRSIRSAHFIRVIYRYSAQSLSSDCSVRYTARPANWSVTVGTSNRGRDIYYLVSFI